MFLRQFIQSVLGLAFLVSSSFAFSNTEFTYNVIDGGIEVTGCVEECPSDLVIPEEIDGFSATSIGDDAFSSKQIISLTLPDSLKNIGSGAFKNNELKILSLPENVTNIGDFAFYNNQLTDISFSDSLLEIGDWAFRLNNLVSIDIPDSVTSIGVKAFAYNQLQEVSYPTKLKSVIEDSPYNYFGNNSGIASVDFRYLNLSGVAVITGCTNTCEPNLVIPENIDGFTVLYIDQEAFLDEQIISVTFPDTLTTIGHRAFKNNQLTTLTIPLNVNTVGSLAFENNQITSVNILGDHVTIAIYALRDNPLQEIVSCGYLQLNYNDPAEINYITPALLDDCSNLSEHSVAIQYATFDIDQSGSVDALSDGLILLRYFFGLRGDSLISGVISPNANRTSAADIEAYIESHMP
jgi:hypothetical protein